MPWQEFGEHSYGIWKNLNSWILNLWGKYRSTLNEQKYKDILRRKFISLFCGYNWFLEVQKKIGVCTGYTLARYTHLVTRSCWETNVNRSQTIVFPFKKQNTPGIPALGRWNKEDQFKASLATLMSLKLAQIIWNPVASKIAVQKKTKESQQISLA